MAVPRTATPPASKYPVNWPTVIWTLLMHGGALLAPLAFTGSGLAVCLILYAATGLGITMGYHRLLTHRSFQTPRWMEYLLTVLGALANQGGALQWVATHRAHHAHSDEDGDPHSPRDGGWWAHMLWWTRLDPILDHPVRRQQYVRDLVKDPVHGSLHRCHILLQVLLAATLFLVGELWQDAGLSWLVWGTFVRVTVMYHTTWLVNSAAHMWGYRTYDTGDRSTNLWWVALLAFGEGWHNNHHAFPRSARHGLRWWELDVTYLMIRVLGVVGLATDIQLPAKIRQRSG